MFKLVIQDDEGKTTVVPLIRDEITIGRKEGNTIRLTERNVSRRHARILRNNGEVHIEDLGSYNGIRVNNARIAERVSLRVSDQVQIGDYKLYLKAEGLEQVDEARTVPMERVEAQQQIEALGTIPPGGTAPLPVQQPPAVTPAPQLVGTPGRTMVAISDTDPTVRSIGPATAAAVAAMTAPGGYGKLVVLSSNFAGKEFELSRPQMIIGRTDENDIVINHRSISRNHAKLVREPETSRYTISDLQSSNGVRVNGQDYGKVELRRGDVVDLGHVRLRFVEAGEDFVFARDAVITDVPESGTKRGMLVAILAAVVVIVAGVVLYMMRAPETKEIVQPGSGTNGAALLDAGDTVVVATPGSDVAVDDAAVAVVAPGVKPEDEKKCIEAQAARDWQGLIDCAKGLDALGAKDRAKEFQAKAVKEQENELKAQSVTQALKERNLKEAEQLLAKIGDGSVYYKALSDQFNRAEAPILESNLRKAQAYAANHDCVGLRQWKVQAAATTTRIFKEVQSVKCTEKVQQPVEQPAIKPAITTTEPVAATPPKNACDSMNVDDLMTQAANQYRAGYPRPALVLVLKVLQCRQDTLTYRFAVMYACDGKDAAVAKQYFPKVPQANQAGLEQKCQQQGISLR
jgi:pSer/pThr/pTyr-binding forkhead associated (FHA) protein